jgi:hypothetical protein
LQGKRVEYGLSMLDHSSITSQDSGNIHQNDFVSLASYSMYTAAGSNSVSLKGNKDQYQLPIFIKTNYCFPI